MKLVTFATTDGQSREVTVTPEAADALVQALAAQTPAHPVLLDDGSVLHLNTRQVIGLAVDDAPTEVSQSDSAEEAPAEQPTVKMIPDPDPQADPDRTVAQLKEALDTAEVEYPSGALKAELQELARANNV